jgi:hypothetical protein
MHCQSVKPSACVANSSLRNESALSHEVCIPPGTHPYLVAIVVVSQAGRIIAAISIKPTAWKIFMTSPTAVPQPSLHPCARLSLLSCYGLRPSLLSETRLGTYDPCGFCKSFGTQICPNGVAKVVQLCPRNVDVFAWWINKNFGSQQDRVHARGLAASRYAARLHRSCVLHGFHSSCTERAECIVPRVRPRLLQVLVSGGCNCDTEGRKWPVTMPEDPGLGCELRPDLDQRFAVSQRLS